MAGAGEQRDQMSCAEGGRDDDIVVEMPGTWPGIVGDEDVARRHGRYENLLDKIPNRFRHCVDVPWGPGPRLRQHAATCVEDTRRQVSGLTNDRTERRAQ